MDKEFSIDLDVYEGPVELLLHLIRVEEADIHDIPIARITREYLEYIEILEQLNLEAAGDFILMAATLMRVKARMLMPVDQDEDDELDDDDDPRQELVERLLEYKKYKELSSHLEDRLVQSENLFNREKTLLTGDREVRYNETDFYALISAFKKVYDTIKKKVPKEIEGEEYTVEDKVSFVREKVMYAEFIRFSDLFLTARSKLEMIVTLIAILELIRLGGIRTRQKDIYSDIYIYGVQNECAERFP